MMTQVGIEDLIWPYPANIPPANLAGRQSPSTMAANCNCSLKIASRGRGQDDEPLWGFHTYGLQRGLISRPSHSDVSPSCRASPSRVTQLRSRSKCRSWSNPWERRYARARRGNKDARAQRGNKDRDPAVGRARRAHHLRPLKDIIFMLISPMFYAHIDVITIEFDYQFVTIFKIIRLLDFRISILMIWTSIFCPS
jgi:hypothetical protein